MGLRESIRLVWSALKLWWEVWLGLWLFGLVWGLCWITIVLGPPATFGFFHAVHSLAAQKEIRWGEYYRAAKANFFTSWIWSLANLVFLFVVFANYVFYGNMEGSQGRVLQVLALVVGILWVVLQMYALPYYVLQEKKSLWVAWKNALFTWLASPLFSLVISLVLALLGFLHVFILPVFLAGPGLAILLGSLAVEDRIQKFGIREREAGQQSA